MIWLILLYIVPAIIVMLELKESFNTLVNKPEFIPFAKETKFAYATLVFIPVLNFVVCLYMLYCHVCEIFNKD